MIDAIAADLLVVAHFAFIVFVVVGGFLVLKWPRVALLHVPCVLWGVLLELGGWMCPLTPLEGRFREAAGQAGYTGGFIDHYVMPLVYPEGLTRRMQIAIGVAVLAVNLCAYGALLVRRAGRKRLSP
jgi:hypothetical protein